MQVTAGTLATIAGRSVNSNMESTIAGLEMAGVGVGLNRPHRLAQYLAQLAHESGLWRYDREVWGPTEAQKRYEGRKDLGNTEPGDGSKFRGHTAAQITGRANTTDFRDWCRKIDPRAPDFVANPGLMNTDPWEGLGPIWYWDTRGLNRYADNGDLLTITKRINGGTNGLADRQAQYTRAGLVLLGYAPADVRAFQRSHGLTVDGISGPRTRAAIHAELLKRPIVAFGTQRPATTIAPGNIRPTPKPVPVIDTLPPQPARSGPPTMTLIALVVFAALLAVFLLKG